MRVPAEFLFLRRKVLPIFTSAESAECGLACLAMVASYHGHEVNLNGLRQKYPSSMSGVTLKGIIDIADELGFASRPLRVEMEDLRELELPAIVHWNLMHFVVLKAVNRKKIVIHDPSHGELTISYKEFSENFTGVVLELYPEADFKIQSAKLTVRLSDLWGKLHGVVNAAGMAIALSLCVQILTFIAPFQMQLVIDQAVGQGDADILLIILISFGFLSAFQIAITFMREISLLTYGNQLVVQVVGNLFRHLIRLPSSYFENRHVGDILSRLGSTQIIKETLTQGSVSGILDGLMSILAVVIMLFYSVKLSIIVLASFLTVALINTLVYPITRRRTEEAIVTSAKEQSHLMETVRAVTTIKLMAREAIREADWKNLYIKTINAGFSAQRISLVYVSAIACVTTLEVTSIVYLGARDIISASGFSLGMLTAFLGFRQTFSDRGKSLVQQVSNFRMMGLQLERLSDIVVQEREVGVGDSCHVELKGDIELCDVGFRYGTTDRWIFQNVNLSIKAGDFVALIGPSGEGKTTLIKLIVGLQIPTTGKVLIDDQAVNGATWRNFRSQAGVVSQTDHLLSGSLADNIAFFDPDMNMERVTEAAISAHIHEEIKRMPMAYNTLIGDMGSSLSGGQRQRVLLARALYKQPKVLILDEGTANLDPANEAAISKIISELNITRIVVAHRPALIERAGRILEITSGMVIEKKLGYGCNEINEIEST